MRRGRSAFVRIRSLRCPEARFTFAECLPPSLSLAIKISDCMSVKWRGGEPLTEFKVARPLEGESMRSLSITILILLLASAVFAQSDRGTLTGAVTDPANAAVPG